MKILFGSIVTDARGRLNGHVFKKTQFGHSISRLALPRNRYKWQQNKQVGQMARVLALWSQTHESAKQDWRTFAQLNPLPNAFGVLRNIGGRAMQSKLAWQFSFPEVVSPAEDILHNVVPPAEIAVLGVDAGTGLISFEYFENVGTVILNIYVQRTNSAVLSPPPNGWQRIPNLQIASAGVHTSAFDIRTVLGSDLNNGKLWVKFRLCNDCGWGNQVFTNVLTVD